MEAVGGHRCVLLASAVGDEFIEDPCATGRPLSAYGRRLATPTTLGNHGLGSPGRGMDSQSSPYSFYWAILNATSGAGHHGEVVE